MKINLGYACSTNTLDITSSSTVTYTNYLKTKNLNKIDETIISNLGALKEILIYNNKNNIHFFRLTSKLIPLATKEDVEFEYIKKYEKEFNELKPLLKNIRLDVHPDQFTVINSVKEDVIKRSIDNLEYHYKVLDALGIKNKIMIIHIGSNVFGKKQSIARFINNYRKLPIHLQESIAIENDDKIFTVKDCLYISKKLNIPFVLDYHHYICNNENESIEKILPEIISTWKNNKPKMHFSSPKSKLKKEFRSHHDFIDPLKFIEFLNIIKHLQTDVDVMLEAKAKDEALYKLIRQLKYYTDLKIKDTTIYL